MQIIASNICDVNKAMYFILHGLVDCLIKSPGAGENNIINLLAPELVF